MLLLGLLLGSVVAVQPAFTAAAWVGAAIFLAGAYFPPLLVVLTFAAMLLDRAGVSGVDIDEFPITASKLSVLAMLGLWGAHAGVRRVRAVRWHPVLSALCVLIAATGLTIAAANAMRAGKFTLLGLAMMLVLVALVYAILAEARLDRIYVVCAAMLVLALAASLAGERGAGEAARASGTLGDPNEWAAAVLLLAPFLLGGLEPQTGWVARMLRVALVMLAPVSILLSSSRSALLVGIAMLPAVGWLLRERRGEVLACAAAAAVAVPIVVDLDTATYRFRLLLDTLDGTAAVRDSSLAERSELLRQAWALFVDHWFIGVGPGKFATASGFVSEQGGFRPAHNTYLEVASEQGVVGLAALGLFMATVALTLWRGWRTATDPIGRSRTLGAAIGLGGFALMAATLGLLTFALAWLVLGISLAVVHQATRRHVG